MSKCNAWAVSIDSGVLPVSVVLQMSHASNCFRYIHTALESLKVRPLIARSFIVHLAVFSLCRQLGI